MASPSLMVEISHLNDMSRFGGSTNGLVADVDYRAP